jgi:hypothetical protein
MGLSTVEDALYTLPFRYEDRRSFRRIGELRDGHIEVFAGEIVAAGESRTPGVATNASRNGVTAAIDEVIRLEGRSWQRVEVDADTLTAELLSVQAVIVHAQGRESDARLLELGTEWGKALAQFVARGGVIVVFEAPGSNAGTFQVLAPSGLFEAAGRETIANNLRLVIAQDQVGLGVARHATTRYESRRSTMRFQGVTSPAGVVVTDPDGLPVVLHRRVAPP